MSQVTAGLPESRLVRSRNLQSLVVECDAVSRMIVEKDAIAGRCLQLEKRALAIESDNGTIVGATWHKGELFVL
jgi:hypothetical protein